MAANLTILGNNCKGLMPHVNKVTILVERELMGLVPMDVNGLILSLPLRGAERDGVNER